MVAVVPEVASASDVAVPVKEVAPVAMVVALD